MRPSGFIEADDETSALHRAIVNLGGEFEGFSSSIVKLASGATANTRLAVVSTGSLLHVLELNLNGKTARALEVKPLNLFVEPPAKEEEHEHHGPVMAEGGSVGLSTVLHLPGYVYSGGYYGRSKADKAIAVTPTGIRVASGLYGVCEADLAGATGGTEPSR